ncbi:hypothetical protein ACFSR7_25525 [Cohnella sp. GCM10020058]|uniref:hypothetical protein n=1 Tax=Cohnella sp. GCM10020058 TaxID=3317330 RepID=UPI00364153CF
MKKEDKYFYNGVNYRLMILGQEQGVWKIIENSIAPIVAISNANLGFGSPAEQDAIKIARSRSEGIIINKKGEVLEDLRATSKQIEAEKGFLQNQHEVKFLLKNKSTSKKSYKSCSGSV